MTAPESQSEHRIGIVTGSGPEAGIDLWSKVLEERRNALGTDFRGDIDAPNVTIVSVPELGLSMDLPDTYDAVWGHLRSACERLADQVDKFAIACNTLYAYQPNIEALDLPATLVSPVDGVRSELSRLGESALGLFGAGPVADLDGGLSPYATLRDDFIVEVPSDPDQLHSLIERIKVVGRSTPELVAEFAEIASSVTPSVGVLACTELPLLQTDAVPMTLIDPTRLLARGLLGT